MLLYPQLLSGAIAQYPLRISREMANAFNLQEDGTRYLEVTTNPSTLRWQLTYQHLRRQEIDALRNFSRRRVVLCLLLPSSTQLETCCIGARTYCNRFGSDRLSLLFRRLQVT